MGEFRKDSQNNNSSDDGLEVEVWMKIWAMYYSVPDNESDHIVPPKRWNVLRIDSDTENSEGGDEEHLGQIEDTSKSDE